MINNSQTIEKQLVKYNINPGNIMFELTETAVMENLQTMKEIFEKLNDLGVCLAIDDFGTGYSSLSYLKELPLKMLKIDKTFVQELEYNSNCRAIIEGTILLAKALSLDIIAEGTETNKQVDLLNEYGCQYAQGYYFAKPMIAKRFVEFVNDFNNS